MIRQAGETGQLYGSVSTRDIAETASSGGFSIERRQVRLDRAIKSIGLHQVQITLHPEVEVPITINVARSADEAERQARGEDLTRPDIQLDEEELAEVVAAEIEPPTDADAEAAAGGRGRKDRLTSLFGTLEKGRRGALFHFTWYGTVRKSFFHQRIGVLAPRRKQYLNGKAKIVGRPGLVGRRRNEE